ncbi:hypothetical protein BZK42_26195 [Citrobacter braakii]|uniref:Uncharacterized protein n=1 Tax=Citrobacter braakii TaxID=57706 RepID=A0A1V8NS04_CITBR|nr:hypothetical protein BZK42_26195 [Citrobacter braakii]
MHVKIDIFYWYLLFGAVIRRPSFFGGLMSKFALILLGIGFIFAFIVILLAVIDEYLHGHDG